MIALTLAAGMIPEGTTVRKPTGTKQYVLCHSIKIYGPERQEIKPEAGLVFMVSKEGGEGSINAVGRDKPLSLDLWLDDAIDFLQGLQAQAEEDNAQ